MSSLDKHKDRGKMRRTKAFMTADKATKVYLKELSLAGVNLTNQQLKQVKENIRNLSMDYIESAYTVSP